MLKCFNKTDILDHHLDDDDDDDILDMKKTKLNVKNSNSLNPSL